jgi:hypothetical protein
MFLLFLGADFESKDYRTPAPACLAALLKKKKEEKNLNNKCKSNKTGTVWRMTLYESKFKLQDFGLPHCFLFTQKRRQCNGGQSENKKLKKNNRLKNKRLARL